MTVLLERRIDGPRVTKTWHGLGHGLRETDGCHTLGDGSEGVEHWSWHDSVSSSSRIHWHMYRSSSMHVLTSSTWLTLHYFRITPSIGYISDGYLFWMTLMHVMPCPGVVLWSLFCIRSCIKFLCCRLHSSRDTVRSCRCQSNLLVYAYLILITHMLVI